MASLGPGLLLKPLPNEEFGPTVTHPGSVGSPLEGGRVGDTEIEGKPFSAVFKLFSGLRLYSGLGPDLPAYPPGVGGKKGKGTRGGDFYPKEGGGRPPT